MIKPLSDLVNARLIAEGHREFDRPSDEELDRIERGDHVKVNRHGERFWIAVTRVIGDRILGRVANDLVRPENADLPLGRPVCVERDHVYDVQKKGGPVATTSTPHNLRQVSHATSAYGRKS